MTGGRFESNLLTLQGRPKHTSRGYSQSHTCNISPFLSGLWIRVTVLDYRVRRLCTRMCAHEKRHSKKVREKSTCRANQVLKLTDYHISRHVVSTFKRLTTTTTHCDLNTFSLHRRGITTTQPPPVILILQQYVKLVNSYNLARGRKPLDFYFT